VANIDVNIKGPGGKQYQIACPESQGTHVLRCVFHLPCSLFVYALTDSYWLSCWSACHYQYV